MGLHNGNKDSTFRPFSAPKFRGTKDSSTILPQTHSRVTAAGAVDGCGIWWLILEGLGSPPGLPAEHAASCPSAFAFFYANYLKPALET